MRYLGIDYGTKRVGLALSDEAGMMAFPHAVLKNTPALLKELSQIITAKQVGKIVIGHSLSKTATPNAVQSAINELVTNLTLETGLPIHLEPELYTTQAAIQIQGRTAHTDASAAALILDGFLSKIK